MPLSSLWARVRARSTVPLRRGAWYRVVALDGRTATLDVNSRLLAFRRPLLQILPIRPPAWSVVPRGVNGSGPGHRYGVCPSCSDRARLEPEARAMRCRRCRGMFAVVWSDAAWRAFEIASETPDQRLLARARATALRVLAQAAFTPLDAPVGPEKSAETRVRQRRRRARVQTS